jgi:hypothetical protein
MEYVEFLRIRRSLVWHIGILAVLALGVMALAGHETSVNVNGTTQLMSGMHVPLGILAAIAGFFAAIFASSAGTSFNRESLRREISWTKPLSRTALAIRFVLIDVAGIGVAYAVALAAISAVLMRMQITPFLDETAPLQLALGFGVGAMWYALIQLLTCMLSPSARAISGILWPVAFAVSALTQVPGITGALFRVLDVINPLAYLSNTAAGAHSAPVLNLPLELRALTVWGFSILFCAIAVAIWPRKEA